jgi:hypothetical protein
MAGCLLLLVGDEGGWMEEPGISFAVPMGVGQHLSRLQRDSKAKAMMAHCPGNNLYRAWF